MSYALPISLSLATLALAGCASLTDTNTSLLDGKREFGRAEMHTYPVQILAVDGEYVIDPWLPRVQPGQHTLRVSAPPATPFTESVVMDVPFTVEACKRYYLVAKRDNPLRQAFELVVQHSEARPDCRVG
jgi:hypothetical protein